MTLQILLEPTSHVLAAAQPTSHLTYLEAGVVGLVQGVAEMFPVSSLGHNVLIPALVGGTWAKDLNVASPESPYLAFIVGLHVATALAMITYFWRDWIRIIGGFFTSFRQFASPAPGTRRFELADPNQKLAWMIILATIPVGLVGLAFEHAFRVIFGKPVYAAVFLAVNGLILLAGERFRPRKSAQADYAINAGQEMVAEREVAAVGARQVAGRHSAGHAGQRRAEVVQAVRADRRIADAGYVQGVIIGSAQILALLAGISRDGVVMVTGMFRGMSRQDAARFSFLLSAPVILAAGVLKVPSDLFGPLGRGIGGPILFGSILSGVGAYLSVRFLIRYLRTRTLTPFGIYSLVVGLACVAYLGFIK
jgi:undecaprenyl-diphosphatase